MELGELIDALGLCKPDLPVYFDFCGFRPRPGSLHSYRGVAYDLALGYVDDNGPDVVVGALLAELQQAVGKTFEGYKGGEYTMDRRTPVWVANRGDWLTHTQVARVRVAEFKVILETVYDDPDFT